MRTLAAVLIVVLVGGSAIQAQGAAEKEATSRPNPTQPGKYYKVLDSLAGSWDVVTRFRYGPGPEREGKATSESKWILDGRYMQHEYTSEIGGRPFITLQYLGYDNQKKKYFEIKMDNAETGVLHTEGTISPDEKNHYQHRRQNRSDVRPVSETAYGNNDYR